MNTLLGRFVLYINTCVKKDVHYDIARYIIEHYLECENMTLRMICDECYVSRASVTRFCEYFGFHSWQDMHLYLVRTKKVKVHQDEDRFKHLDIETLYKRLGSMVNKEDDLFFYGQMKALVKGLVEDIYKNNRIYLFGAIYPLSLAVNFQINMISIGKVIFCDYQSERSELEEMKKDDLAIILTASGRYISECKAKFNAICSSPANKMIITSSSQYRKLQYIQNYIMITSGQEGKYQDFDYYLMILLDLIYITYHNTYCKEMIEAYV